MSCGSKKKTIWHAQVNGGETQVVELTTSEYLLASLACLGLLEYTEAADYNVVKIWVPELVEAGYGPYFYGWDGHHCVFPSNDRRW
jgi:hypothetical protein